MEEILIVNEHSLPVHHENEREPYEYLKREVRPHHSKDQCYVALYEIPPQKMNYPYHYHMAVTEVFYILEGEGVLETPQGERRVQKGDIVICPPGEKSAHRMKNTSQNEPLRYLDVDTSAPADVIHYPHTGKTGVIVSGVSTSFFSDDTQIPYYEKEPDGT